MPRQQRVLLKYRCQESFCAKIIRQDKWPAHCKAEHPFKFRRGEEIKKLVVARKEGDGPWTDEKSKIRPKYDDKSCTSDTNASTTPEASALQEFSVNLNQTDADLDQNVHAAENEILCSEPPSRSSSCNNMNNLMETSEFNISSPQKLSVSQPAGKNDSDSVAMCAVDAMQASSPILDFNDPALYCGRRLQPSEINACLNAGPCHPDYDYSYTVSDKRSFSRDWLMRELPDGSKRRRMWLTYSKSNNKAYCIPCMLFSTPQGSEAWTSTGYDEWHNAIRNIQRHEGSSEHRQAEIAQLQWKSKKTIIHMIDKNRSARVEDNRNVLECAIDCIRYLSSEMIAIWGNTPSEGKFFSLFRLMAKRDATAAAYLMKLDKARQESKKMAQNLISPRNIRLLLTTMKQMIVQTIISQISVQKKACIIFDSTQDYSKKESSVLLARYLKYDTNGQPSIAERLVEVFTTGETSGEILSNEVISVLKKVTFQMDWLVGQCYDGAGNMRGKYAGLAAIIQKSCPRAVYIWCHAHRLNLIMNSVTSCCNDIRNALGLLEELHNFMNGHKRNDVFQHSQDETRGKKMQLKRVSTTRWSSTEAAVDTVLARYSEVLNALSTLSLPSYDSETVTLATGLRVRLNDFRVILCLHVLKLIYHITGPASRQLQSTAIDLASAASLLNDCTQQFNAIRLEADQKWIQLFDNAVKFAEAHNVTPEFRQERSRKKKKMVGEVSDDSRLSGIEQFKVETFICVIDQVCQQMSSRFSEQNVSFMKQLAHFTPVSLNNSSHTTSKEDIRGICEQYSLNVDEIYSELTDFRQTYKVCAPVAMARTPDSSHTPAQTTQLDFGPATPADSQASLSVNDLLSSGSDDEMANADDNAEDDETGHISTFATKVWENNSFIVPLQLLNQLSGYPNLLILYAILCCLPVSSASAERALSKLKIVKNRLRTSLSDSTLSSLLLLASEKDILLEISNEDIINRMAIASPSLKSLLLF